LKRTYAGADFQPFEMITRGTLPCTVKLKKHTNRILLVLVVCTLFTAYGTLNCLPEGNNLI
jgi:hypothetical protein